MIKINLLPKTINQKVIIRNTSIAFGVALVAIIVGGVYWGSTIAAQVELKQQEADAAEAFKSKVDGIQKQADTVLASIDPLKKKLDFINAVLDYNTKYPKLYAEVAQWTYKNVEYTSLLCDGTKIDITGKAKNLDEFGRYLLNMYKAKDLYSEVTVVSAGQLTGGAAGPAATTAAGGNAARTGGNNNNKPVIESYHPGWIDFAVTCKLNSKKVIPPPVYGGAAPAANTGAPGGTTGPETPTLPVLPTQDKKQGQ